MEIIQIVVIGLVSTILIITIKKYTPEFAMLVSMATCIIIIFMLFPKLVFVLDVLKKISESINTKTDYIGIIFKIIGVTYVTEFGSMICQDAGENAIASKIDIGGKILIMAISAPVLLSLLDIIINFIP